MERLDPVLMAGLRPGGDDLDSVRRAYAWAVAAHAGQVRKDGSRLIDHVMGVARNVQSFAGPGADLLTAALLHDIVENTPVTLDEVSSRFGSTVAGLVDAVTVRAGESARDAARRARDCGDEALMLRLCDRLDGIRRSPGRPEAKRAAFLRTSREVHLALAREHFPDLADTMREALDHAEATLGDA